jgi:outer membrane protein
MTRQSAVRCLSVGAAAVLLTVCFTAHAWCQEEKIGVVDMTRVIDLSKQGKKSMEEMADKFKGAKKDLEKRQSNLVSMKNEIEKNAMILSGEALAQKERRYQDELTEYQRRLEDYQKQLTEKNREVSNEMMTLTEDVVNAIGGEGYLLILEKTSSGILYYTDDVDLTGEVIERLNKK